MLAGREKQLSAGAGAHRNARDVPAVRTPDLPVTAQARRVNAVGSIDGRVSRELTHSERLLSRGGEPPVAHREQVRVSQVVEEAARLVEASREIVEHPAEACHGCALGGGPVPPGSEPLEQPGRAAL